jgi:hypothetical protein
VDVELPDGTVLKGVPDNATKTDIIGKLQNTGYDVSTLVQQEAGRMATSGMSGLEKFNAGMGKAFTDIWRGAGQMVGLGPSSEEVRETRTRDAPLVGSGAGMTGNIAGNFAMLGPAAVVPGAATVPAAGAMGSILAGLQPTETTGQRLGNMGVGLALGSGSQYAGTTAARMIGEKAAGRQIQSAQQQAQNAVRDQALQAGRKAGYVVPPSTINPTLVNQGIESVGGKIATQQQASVTNQKVTDTLGREALGLKPSASLTDPIIKSMKASEGKAYAAIKSYQGRISADPKFTKEVGSIGQDITAVAKEFPKSTKNTAIENLLDDLSIGDWSSRSVIDKVRFLRSDASANFKAFNDPEKLSLARAQRQAAEALDNLVERNLAGQQSLSADYKSARVNLARLHDIEAALTPGGHIDARVIAKIGENSRLTGPLKVIADFAGNFPKAVQTGERVGSPMVHALRPTLGTGVGAMVGGLPGAAVGGAAGVAVPWAARGAMLSGPGQSLMATPKYSPGLLGSASQVLPRPETLGLLSRTAIPAIYSGLLE